VKYKTATAFRHALEERLRQKSLSDGAPLARLRKMVAFDRFLARVAKKQPDAWIVKGGFALQLRLGERARTTKKNAWAEFTHDSVSGSRAITRHRYLVRV